MRPLRVGVIDVVANYPAKSWYARLMRANLAAIMPQVIAVWCAEGGHDVHMAVYSGYQNLTDPLPDDLDVVFVSAFTTSAHVAYALSSKFRQEGVVTVLGGPHARAYPEDACLYFDYVAGFTDKTLVLDLLADAQPQRPEGVQVASAQQPRTLPSLEARWPYVERLLQEAPLVKIVPMIGSLGCPYTCSFCVDSIVPYQPLDFDQLKADLRFLLTKVKKPVVGWHDPNFGVRFNDYLGAIEEAVPPGSIDFIAESTLSLLSEKNVKRLKKNGFAAILPGIESWYDMGNKSKTGNRTGMDKVNEVAEQVNMILSYLPYFQGNFVLGLDCDEGDEPFELTKQFLDMAPGVFPAYSMLTAFGRSAPLNLTYQQQGRVIGFPFHFLNNNGAMNVRPKNYEWVDFYDKMISLHEHSFSKGAIYRRMRATRGMIPRLMNIVRAVSSEGWGKIKYYQGVRHRLQTDRGFRRFMDQETDEVPQFFVDRIEGALGPLWPYLAEGGVFHDPYAYLKTEQARRSEARGMGQEAGSTG